MARGVSALMNVDSRSCVHNVSLCILEFLPGVAIQHWTLTIDWPKPLPITEVSKFDSVRVFQKTYCNAFDFWRLDIQSVILFSSMGSPQNMMRIEILSWMFRPGAMPFRFQLCRQWVSVPNVTRCLVCLFVGFEVRVFITSTNVEGPGCSLEDNIQQSFFKHF